MATHFARGTVKAIAEGIKAGPTMPTSVRCPVWTADRELAELR